MKISSANIISLNVNRLTGGYIDSSHINTSDLTISELYYNSNNKVTIDSTNGMLIYKGGSVVAQYSDSFATSKPIQFNSGASTTFRITSTAKKIGLKHGKRKQYEQDLRLSDYYPIGVVGWNFDGTCMSTLSMSECHLLTRKLGFTTVRFYLKNRSSKTDCTTTGSTPTTIRIKVLWVYCGDGFNISETETAGTDNGEGETDNDA